MKIQSTLSQFGFGQDVVEAHLVVGPSSELM
jgi:hypothetical protein